MRKIESFEIKNEWDIGSARRYIANSCRDLGFNEIEVGEISIVVNELCTNIIKHGCVEGKIKFSKINNGLESGIEIISHDKGPGIENIDEVIKDGFSSKGTIGGGFGAIKRLMDDMEVYSQFNGDSCNYNPYSYNLKLNCTGTIIVAKKWLKSVKNIASQDIKISVMSRPHPNSNVNGDGYYIKHLKGKSIIAVIDGIGHGTEANKASKKACELIEENISKCLKEIILSLDTGLRHTRGVVIGLLAIDEFKGELTYVGIGNIQFTYIFEDNVVRILPTSGILGVTPNNKVRIQKVFYQKGSILIMNTDGISNKWQIDNYSREVRDNPSFLSNSILKDFGKNNDDSTVLVAVL
ncbi:ATP-binding SpoIIE family protein phosphatase [Clostridium cylindrosporum]|uniref:Stage II sporulation protein E n=1 Tax=Clostridium cylindrosporum DSM 605 TaxID=1121307 RepID=A0A0J8D7J7_CLOCY|nr:ATP-binding SpoIIE family protein phosphatase [Clostridium cylindrosporum]KMT22000.1 stage II sporulation protein E [Clostridium cylindrosporum DSM 605]